MSTIQEIIDSWNINEPIYDAVFEDGGKLETAESSLEFPTDPPLPTQSQYNEMYAEKNNIKLEDEKCGMCVRWAQQSPASKMGFCKFHGSMTFIKQEKCQKYVQSKRSKLW